MKTYTVVTTSTNANAFGLRAVIFLAADGSGVRALKAAQFAPKPGRQITIDERGWAAHGYECPEELPRVSAALATRVLCEVATKSEH